MSDTTNMISPSERGVTSEHPHTCGWCASSFPTNNALNAHVHLVHDRTLSSICRLCYEGLGNDYLLAHHEARHADLPPYLCDTCGDRFDTFRACIAHLWTTHGQRPYPCLSCPQSFNSSPQLYSHVQRTHGGVKRHACTHPGCTYTSPFTHNIPLHVRLCHPAP